MHVHITTTSIHSVAVKRCVCGACLHQCAHTMGGGGRQKGKVGKEQHRGARMQLLASGHGGLVLTVWSGGMSSDTFDRRGYSSRDREGTQECRLSSDFPAIEFLIPSRRESVRLQLFVSTPAMGGGCSVKNEPIHTGTDLVFYKGNHRNSHGGNVQSKPCL